MRKAKPLILFAIASVVVQFAPQSLSAQTWTPLTHQPTFSGGTALLLTDGTVMIQDSGAANWWKLTPDINGSYVNGTFSQLASSGSYAPLYYASAVLPDGRVIVEGGEYNNFSDVESTMGAIYDPVANKWTTVAPPAGWSTIGDAAGTILPSGLFLLTNCCTAQLALLNPKTLAWSALSSAGKADGDNNEEGLTLLPNGTLLTVDTNNVSNPQQSELYLTKQQKWISAGNTPMPLTDKSSHEIGPAVLRPDGTVFYTGGTGNTAVYTPPVVAGTTGVWTAGPVFPKVNNQQLDIADGPAALLPNGNVLTFASPGVFLTGGHFYEFNGTTLTAEPSTPNASKDSSYVGRMLILPTGQILFADGSTSIYLYNSTGTYNPAWAPTITSVPGTLTHGQTYTASGVLFNGLSQGATYGDDAQMATNYPLVQITNIASGHVFYARTHNFSAMPVASSATVSTQFDVPAGIEIGSSNLVVIANGIPSAPSTVVVQ